MMQIIEERHNKATAIYTLSRLAEQMAFYGLTYLITWYIIEIVPSISFEKSTEITNLFNVSILFTSILGGILGDLFIGHKRALIFGGILLCAGAICLISPQENLIYFVLFFIAIGLGLFNVNSMALFAKNYYDKIKLLDAGFTLHFTMANIGSFLGILIIPKISEALGYPIAFACIALLFLKVYTNLNVSFNLLCKIR